MHLHRPSTVRAATVRRATVTLAVAAAVLAPLACDDDGGDDGDPGSTVVEPGGSVAPQDAPTGSPLQPQSNLSTPQTSGAPGPTGDVTEDVVEGTNPDSPDGDD